MFCFFCDIVLYCWFHDDRVLFVLTGHHLIAAKIIIKRAFCVNVSKLYTEYPFFMIT